MRRFMLLTMLAGLILLAAACEQATAPKTSTGPKLPAPEIVKATPVPIPVTTIPGDGKVPVYLKIREPLKTLERVSEWTSSTMPMMTASTMAQQIEMMGIPISRFTPGGNMLVAVWPQMGSAQFGGILPLNEPADLSRFGVQTEMIPGGGLLFGMDTAGQGMKQAQTAREDLVKIEKAPIDSDFELGADVQLLWPVFGPLARLAAPSFINGIMAGQQMGDQASPMPPNMKAVLMTEAAAVMDFLNQVRDATFRVKLDKDALELSAVVSAIKTPDGGTTLSKFLSAEPVAAPELTRFVSRNQIVGQSTVRDMGKMMEIMFGYMANMVQDQPGAIDELRRQFAGIEKIGAMHTAFGMSMSPNAAMRLEYVMVADHPDELMKLVHEKIAAINSGPLHEFYVGLDMDVHITTQPLTRQYKGYTIEKYLFRMAPGPNARKIDRQMMAAMFPGEVPCEIAQVGPYTVATMSQPADGTIDRVLSPEGRSPARSVLTFPSGAVFTFDYDLVSYLRAVQSTIPGMEKVRLPASAPAVLIAGYHQQGKAYYVLQIPRKTIIAMSGLSPEAAETTGTTNQ
ncbi:hypothetical protein LLG95_00765 [bacterium]|nr:hypothetical protein [bacterium]